MLSTAMTSQPPGHPGFRAMSAASRSVAPEPKVSAAATKPNADRTAARFRPSTFGCLTARVLWRWGVVMVKSDLFARVAKLCPHLARAEVETLVNAIFDEIAAAMARGDRVELRGFGTFSVKARVARMGRNPKTGSTVAVPRKAAPAFRMGKDMTKRLNRDPADDSD
jgi:integration host factor subunit beta